MRNLPLESQGCPLSHQAGLNAAIVSDQMRGSRSRLGERVEAASISRWGPPGSGWSYTRGPGSRGANRAGYRTTPSPNLHLPLLPQGYHGILFFPPPNPRFPQDASGPGTAGQACWRGPQGGCARSARPGGGSRLQPGGFSHWDTSEMRGPESNCGSLKRATLGPQKAKHNEGDAGTLQQNHVTQKVPTAEQKPSQSCRPQPPLFGAQGHNHRSAAASEPGDRRPVPCMGVPAH